MYFLGSYSTKSMSFHFGGCLVVHRHEVPSSPCTPQLDVASNTYQAFTPVMWTSLSSRSAGISDLGDFPGHDSQKRTGAEGSTFAREATAFGAKQLPAEPGAGRGRGTTFVQSFFQRFLKCYVFAVESLEDTEQFKEQIYLLSHLPEIFIDSTFLEFIFIEIKLTQNIV